MKINNANTVKDHWHAAKSSTRKLMFGVLSRMYFRVALWLMKIMKRINIT